MVSRRGALPGHKLPRSFYARPVLVVARELIGQVLVRSSEQGVTAGRVVECEAYRGPEDLAAHSSRGRTRRTEAMFGPPGYAYVFRLYGVSWAFNVVTTATGKPHAVLVRALEPVYGLDLMAKRRHRLPSARELCNGPGKLCQALGISQADYGRDLCQGELYFLRGTCGRVGRSPRINVAYAGAWAERRWRFFECGNRYVSVLPR